MPLVLRFAVFVVAWSLACWNLSEAPGLGVQAFLLAVAFGVPWVVVGAGRWRERNALQLSRVGTAAMSVFTLVVLGWLAWSIFGRICCTAHAPYFVPGWYIAVVWIVGIGAVALMAYEAGTASHAAKGGSRR